MNAKTKNRLGLIFYFFAILHIFYSFYLATSPTIWFDEIYSMLFAFRPAKELISLTAQDVHPPLYYLILRVFLLMANTFVPALGSETVAKMVSIIPDILMMIISITYIRKRWGFFVSGLYIFSLCFMPEIMQKTVEIRMYGWALLFVTGLGLHFIDIITNRNENSFKDITNYFAIFVYSVAAIYTHYFAAIAVFWIYLGALFIIVAEYIKNRNNGLVLSKNLLRKIIAIIASGFIAVICYIPWISVVLSQVRAVKADYWIYPLSIKAPYSSAMFLLRANFPILIIGTALAVLFIVILLRLMYDQFCKAKNGDIESVMVIYAFCILPLVAVTGYLLSWLIRPIFIDRYLEPSAGMFWLAISLIIGKSLNDQKDNKKHSLRNIAVYIALLLLCINAVVDSSVFYRSETNIRERGKEFNKMLSSIDEDTIIVTNSDLIQSVVTYSLNTDRRVFTEGEKYNQIANYKTYLYGSELKTLISEMLPGFFIIDEDKELKKYIDSGKEIIFMTYSGDIEYITKLEKTFGIDVVLEGSYFYDHYDIDVMTVK